MDFVSIAKLRALAVHAQEAFYIYIKQENTVYKKARLIKYDVKEG